MLSFSIVVNTLNRATLLQKTLESFCYLKYEGDFEVIVVNGPSTDHTEEVIQAWLPNIRTAKCELANLSISRNIGICMARGDIVVFIDDDAVAEPEWLTQLAQGYTDSNIAAVGGFVFDHTGYHCQWHRIIANRLGDTNAQMDYPLESFCFPHSFNFPYLPGTNASFRRSALLEIGGFDEEFEYYLDETEVCLRLIDVGYVIKHVENAFVHHKYAPSHIRNAERNLLNYYTIIKNKIYFSFKYAQDYLAKEAIIENNKKYSEEMASYVKICINSGKLPASIWEKFEKENQQAWEDGIARALANCPNLITSEKLNQFKGEFLDFQTVDFSHSKTIVLISDDYFPNHQGGIATLVKNLAEALANEGHIVYVITRSSDINRVDFENNVWVHRMCVQDVPFSIEASMLNIPYDYWCWSSTAFIEAERIATHRNIDIVEAPIWDCQGVAFLLKKHWPLVVSLETTLFFWEKTHPECSADPVWMETFFKPVVALEKKLMLECDAVRAGTQAIAAEIEAAYDFSFSPDRIKMIHHGIAFPTQMPVTSNFDRPLQVLFVGRFELRKGIDVLLEAIPEVFLAYSNIQFRLIGNFNFLNAKGESFVKVFLEKNKKQKWINSVQFDGYVEEEILQKAYTECDIFVAPSRFESFGLIFLEAMRVRKPVIGCRAGGMPEIISDGVNGILIEPGEVAPLVAAIVQLAGNPALRLQMGKEGEKIFTEHFSSARMAKESEGLYQMAKKINKINPAVTSKFISYAQNFEDIMLWRALKHIKNGFYVDIGAHHPIIHSVSYAFYQQGWRGVHIEPVHEYAELLKKARPDEMVLEIAIGDQDGDCELNIIPGSGLSTCNKNYAKNHAINAGLKSHTQLVPLSTLQTALKPYINREIHWLKIDVEGAEKNVLEGWDSQILRPWIMIVEATIPCSSVTTHTEWEYILFEANYQFVYFDGLNRFYVAKEHSQLIGAFSHPPCVFDNFELTEYSDFCQYALLSQFQKLKGQFQSAYLYKIIRLLRRFSSIPRKLFLRLK